MLLSPGSNGHHLQSALGQEQAACCGGRLFAARPDAAGPVIYLHPSAAVTGLLALPLSSAATTTYKGHAGPCINYWGFLAKLVVLDDLVYGSFVPAHRSGAGTGMFEVNFGTVTSIF